MKKRIPNGIKRIKFSFFVLGFSSLLAQTIILRELIIAFYGNELFSSLTLGFWLILVGFSSFYLSRFLKKHCSLKIISLFHFLIPIFLVLEIILIQLLKNWFSLPGQIPNLLPALMISFLILFPLCFILGIFWTIASKIYGQIKNNFSLSITQGYFFETLGFIVAGLIFSFFLVYLNIFFTIFLVSLINLFSVFFLSFKTKNNKKFSLFLLILFLIFSLFSLFLCLNNNWQKQIKGLKFKNQILVEELNSKYGCLSVTQFKDNVNQYNFFQNGILIGANQEKSFNEKLIHLSLLQSENPKKILLIGQGFNGALTEILSHADSLENNLVEQIYYLELDPKLISLTKKYLPPELKQTLTDPRIKIIYQDGRYFLKKNQEKFDVIVLHLPNPATLLINRFYTEDFFQQAKKHLSSDGLISTYLDSGTNYFSPENLEMIKPVYQALRNNFNNVFVVPEEINLFFASDKKISSSQKIINRFKERKIKTAFISSAWLDYYLNNEQTQKINSVLKKQRKIESNTDLHPRAYLANLIFYIKHFQPKIARGFKNLGKIKPEFILIALFLILILLRKKFTLPCLLLQPFLILLCFL